MPGRNTAYSNHQAVFVARHGARGDRAPVNAVGMSAMTSVDSAKSHLRGQAMYKHQITIEIDESMLASYSNGGAG